MVREEIVLGDSMEKGAMEWVEVAAPAAVSEILAEYDRRHDKVTAQMQALPASRWEETVPVLHQGKEVMRMAAHDMAWAFLLDQIHHQASFTYLRPMGEKFRPFTAAAPTNRRRNAKSSRRRRRAVAVSS